MRAGRGSHIRPSAAPHFPLLAAMDLSDPYSDSSLPPLHTRYPQAVPHSSHHAYYVKQEQSYPPAPPVYHRSTSTPSAGPSHYHGGRGGHSPLHSPTHSGRHSAAYDHYTSSNPAYSSTSALSSSPEEYYPAHDHAPHHHYSHPPHPNSHSHSHSHSHTHSPPPPLIAVPATSVSSVQYSPHSHSYNDSYDLLGSSSDSLPLPLPPLDDEPVYAVHHNQSHAAVVVSPPPVIALGPPPSSPPPAAKRRSRAPLFSPTEPEPTQYAAISPPAAGGSYYAGPSSYSEHSNESYVYPVDGSLQDEVMSVSYPSYPAAIPVRASSPPPLTSAGEDAHSFPQHQAVAAIVVRSDSPRSSRHRVDRELMDSEESAIMAGETEREVMIRPRPLSPSRGRSYSQADIHNIQHQPHHQPHHNHHSHQHHSQHHVAAQHQPVAYYDDGRRVDVHRSDGSHVHSRDRHKQHNSAYSDMSHSSMDANGIVSPNGRAHSILTSPVSQPPAYSSFSSSSSSHPSPRPVSAAPASVTLLRQLQAEIQAATEAGADREYIATKFQQAKDVQRAIMQETMAAGGAPAAVVIEPPSSSAMYEDSGSASTGSSPHSHASSHGRSSPCLHGHERLPHVLDAVAAVEAGPVKHEMGMTQRERDRERDRERATEGGWVEAQHHYGRGHHQHQPASHYPHSHSHAYNIPTAAYISPPASAVATFASPIQSPSTHSTPSPPASVSTASSSDSRPRYSPFPPHAPPPHSHAVPAYPPSSFAVPPPPTGPRSNKRTRSRSEGYSADAHVPGLPAHTQAAHMGGVSVSSQGRDRPATATHHYYHHHHHASHSQQAQPALAVPHYGRSGSSHVSHSAVLLSPSAGPASSAVPFSSLRAVQEHEHDDVPPYHVDSSSLSLPAAAPATVIPPSYSPMSSAQQRSSARTFSAPHSAILIESGDRYHAHASAPSTPIHSPHYVSAQPTSHSAAASPAHRRVIVKARSSSSASSAPVLAPSPAYTVASAGSGSDDVPLLRLHGSSRHNTGELGNARSSPRRADHPSHQTTPPAIDTQLETQSHPSPYGSRHSSPTSSSASSTPPPFRSPTHRPFSFARAPSPRHAAGTAQPQPQLPAHHNGGGNEWKTTDKPAQAVPVVAAVPVKVEEVRVKVEPKTDTSVSARADGGESVGAGAGAQDASSAYSSMEVSTPYSSSTASTATSSNTSSTAASPLASPLQFTAAPPLSATLSLQPPLRFSLSATTPSTTPSDHGSYLDEDDESLEHPSPLQSSSSSLSLSGTLSDSMLPRPDPIKEPLSSPSAPSSLFNASTVSSTPTVHPPSVVAAPPTSAAQPVPAIATVPGTAASNSSHEPDANSVAGSASSSAALSAPTSKKTRKKRRKSTDLPEHERWYCPLSCGKYFRRTSSRSITEHMKNCPSIKKKSEPEDGSGSTMETDADTHAEGGQPSSAVSANEASSGVSGNGLTVKVTQGGGGGLSGFSAGSESGSGGLFSPVTGGLSSAMKELHLQPLRDLEAAGMKTSAADRAVDAAGGEGGGNVSEVNGVNDGTAQHDEDDDGDEDNTEM